MNYKKNILLNVIIGDALGNSFNGLGEAHIRATLKDINGYIDASPALKGKMFKWRKPGLYSSISQFMVILAAVLLKRKFNIDDFCNHILSSPKLDKCKFGIFRNPGNAEQNFIIGKDNDAEAYIPCSRLIPITTPLAFKSELLSEKILNTISFIKLFTKDHYTISGALLYVTLLAQTGELNKAHKKQATLIEKSIKVNNDILNELGSISHSIFSLGLNPDNIISASQKYSHTLIQISQTDDEINAEKIICSNLNDILKTPVKRANVNNPLSILTYSIFLMNQYLSSPLASLLHIAQKGGASSALSSVSGALAGTFLNSEFTPKNLINNLINRKRVINIIEQVNKNRVSEIALEDFIKTEANLTIKENEELNAKLKHIKPKKKKANKKKELDLSKHIVESWTKIDKAKWRRKAKKNNMDKLE
ncbi:ADP-ribosylglycohydrolase family protein [Spirochaetota bacterium]